MNAVLVPRRSLSPNGHCFAIQHASWLVVFVYAFANCLFPLTLIPPTHVHTHWPISGKTRISKKGYTQYTQGTHPLHHMATPLSFLIAPLCVHT
mmetsp:Transcript_17763/g.42678  ORF Transcript_17763/g.42678 Transcript_17763/m.42678 type:complete len:94 (-) Transcript_17763:972-1253(-)